ncbi:rhamnogalacturonan acetylesterase [Streptomyces ficellus]|uniref:Rhamnogalacturonan acetylesterase n=1 Tax=Streptomyces ficellus TaxID=1977088 RepID=A0ABT7ZDP4_9ACTN|nr:rhamnogalacturonan acetylesterase [Streptomyces ficellus]MDN3297633.1 rhamnogalacturonan acetylesterase [Streptomyces ficellus]
MTRKRHPAVLVTALAALAALPALPARAADPDPVPAPAPYGQGIDNCTGTAPVVCHFDVAPGTYDVTLTLGGDSPATTSVTAETRRAMLPETATAAGERVRRAFTVDVRTPEGEPTGPAGTPGLDLTFGGPAPALSAIRVTPAPRARQVVLIGDSTVCDQPGEPYAGWGQHLPSLLTRGTSVANYADSGESTVSFLANQALFPTVREKIRSGDLVLIQLAHNDKQTNAATYRANLTALVDGVRAEGGRPVLVTPIVRRWFGADGTLNNGTALLVNGLGVDHPAEIRALAARLGTPLVDLTALTKARVEALGTEASKALYLTNEKRDNTHTSVRGATEYARLVAAELSAQNLLGRSVR